MSKKVPKLNQQLILLDLENEGLRTLCTWNFRDNRSPVVGYINGLTIALSHLVLQPIQGFVNDHINRNRLDNRKKNLRRITRNANLLNNNATNIRLIHSRYRVKVSNTIHYFNSLEEAQATALNIKKLFLVEALQETRHLNLHLTDEEYYKYV